MTLDETIKYAKEVAEENQRVVDTGIVFDDVTVDMLYCDDTEVIEEHLANYQEYADKYRQIAEWLKDYKKLREQTRWIPCSERLPNDEEYVLVCYEDGHIRTAYYYIDTNIYPSEFEDCCETGWYNYNQEFMLYQDVIAWMPLPKPYDPQKARGEE